MCTFTIFGDPEDRFGVDAYMRQRELEQQNEDRMYKGPLGYQNTIRKQREQNPELYDA